ncbi:MAG: thermonuclease family protein [Pseudomonadota bacterium]
MGDLSTGCALAAQDTLRGPIPATLVRVIDGDTLVVEARIWLGQRLLTRVRLAGIDAPEPKGKCAEETDAAASATARLEVLATQGPLSLQDIRYGTYAGRVVARVVNADGIDLSGTLLGEGLAGLYRGRGPRPNWCAAVTTLNGASSD